MKSRTMDQKEGTSLEGNGLVEETAEELNDNPELEAEGTGGNTDANVQGKVGQFIKILGKD